MSQDIKSKKKTLPPGIMRCPFCKDKPKDSCTCCEGTGIVDTTRKDDSSDDQNSEENES